MAIFVLERVDDDLQKTTFHNYAHIEYWPNYSSFNKS